MVFGFRSTELFFYSILVFEHSGIWIEKIVSKLLDPILNKDILSCKIPNWFNNSVPHVITLYISYYIQVYTRLSKIFETFDIWSDLNFSNTQNSRSEHIWTLNFSIRFDSLRTSNISDISNIFDTLARTDFWVELGWIGCAD